MNKVEQIKKILRRRIQQDGTGKLTGVFPSQDEVVGRLAADQKLVFYLGFDPTGPQVHLGHTIPLLLLRDLAELGHRAIFLIGSFTARIGDPTGKSAARKPLSVDEIDKNSATYIDQVKRIFGDIPFETKHNSDWLQGMTFEDVLRLSSLVTVQQMIQRDMFQERIKQERPIFLHEFLYPLMQGYDSVAMRVDGEVGGNDQTFNMLMGRELAKELIGKDKIVLATRLLMDASTGMKMSKSEGGLIALDDPPRIIFEKVRRTIPDAMLKTAFELCTGRDESWISESFAGRDEDIDFKTLSLELAKTLVEMYYDKETANKALEAYHTVVGGGVPDDSIEVEMAEDAGLVGLIAHGLRISKTEAKRFIDQGSVSVNGETVTKWGHELRKGDTIRIGPGKFIKVT